jgi:starch-binding outer membrane protein SusE/F
MKFVIKIFLVLVAMSFAISCARQLEPVPQFSKSSSAFSATASAATVTAPAADSLKSVLSFDWTDPTYAIGLAKSKFTIVVGPTGKGFANFVSKDFSGVLKGALLGKEINTIALKFGGVVGQPVTLDVKIVASQENNNEPITSNVLQVAVTPFADLVLTPSAASVVTSAANANTVGISFNWNAGFKGYEGTRTYQLQYVKGGTSFTVPTTVDVTSQSKSFTQLELNNIAALEFAVPVGQIGNVDFRIKATNGLGTVIYSNVVAIGITPYLTSFPSIYGMGAALNGWGPWPDAAVEAVSSQFKINEMVAKITNGEAFRFFAQADWGPSSYNYPYFTSVDVNFVNANDNDKNFKFVGTTGWYKVTVNLTTKTVASVAVNEPVLYMMGAALNGWGPTWNENPLTQVKMTYKKPGVFEANPTFKVETFRFFAQSDWGPTSYNYPFFTSVDSKFENANDGDKNLKYIGTPGAYKVRVDLNAKKVTTF